MLKKSGNMSVAALIVGCSIALSRMIGLIRDLTISHLAGATADTDVYYVAFLIPDFINYLLAGAYFSITLIPILAHYTSEGKREECWKIFSPIFIWLSTAIFAVMIIMFAACPAIIRFIAPGFTPSQMARAAHLTRIILPAQCFFIAGSLLMSDQYTFKYFLIPALAPILYNICIIMGGLLFYDSVGVAGFSWGVLAGAFLGNFLLQLFGARRLGLKIVPSLWHPEVRTFVKLAIPIMLGQSVVVLDEQFTRIFGSLSIEGTVSWLNYARRVMMVPIGIVAQAAGVASYPFLAQLVSENRIADFHRQLSAAIRGTLFAIIPFSAWIGAISYPLVMLLFQHGQFTSDDTTATSGILIFYLVGVFAWGIQQVLGRGFYARRKVVAPVVIGTLMTVVSLPLYYLLSRAIGGNGVAAATSAAVILYTLGLVGYWRYRWGSDAFRGVGRQFLAVSLIALPSAFCGHYLSGRLFTLPENFTRLRGLGSLALTSLIFWGLFIGAALLLKIPETALLLKHVPLPRKRKKLE